MSEPEFKEEVALRYLVSLRWPEGPVCPRCAATRAYFITTRRMWSCAKCRFRFSVRAGTPMQDSPLKLSVWLHAVAFFVGGVTTGSALASHLGISKVSGWHLAHRLRAALLESEGLADVNDPETLLRGVRSFGGNIDEKYNEAYLAQEAFLLHNRDDELAFHRLARALITSGYTPLEELRGEPRPVNKLTPDDVRKIRDLRKRLGMKTKDLAEMFDVDRHTITNIMTGKSWSDVE